jgi:hypothetical protein
MNSRQTPMSGTLALGQYLRVDALSIIAQAKTQLTLLVTGSGALKEQGSDAADSCCRPLSKGRIPLFLQRPEIPPAWSKLELMLANSMHEFQPSQSGGRCPIGLEAQHAAASALDRPMILLYEIVQVLDPSHDRCMSKVHIALRHQSHEIAIAQAVSEVPTNTGLDDIARESPTPVDGIAFNGLGHGPAPGQKPRISRPNC